MKSGTGKLWGFYFCLLMVLWLFYAPVTASSFTLGLGGFNKTIPGPDLFSPVTDNIDLKERVYLEFKWRALILCQYAHI
jgi:hypothetical protein